MYILHIVFVYIIELCTEERKIGLNIFINLKNKIILKNISQDGGAFVILLLPLLGGAGLANFGLLRFLRGWSSP